MKLHGPSLTVFKSTKHAKIAVFLGLLLLILYKSWRYYLRNGLGLDPELDYFLYQTECTYFRALNSVLGALLCWLLYANRRVLFGVGRFKIYGALLLQFVLLVAAKLYFNSYPKVDAREFVFELIFNSFTGVSEEYLFRGLVFGGLFYLLGFWRGSLIGAGIFALWHLDVLVSIPYMIFLLSFSLVFQTAFAAGASLIGLSLLHFIWDQVVFGFSWPKEGGAALLLTQALVNIGIFFWINNLRSAKREQI